MRSDFKELARAQSLLTQALGCANKALAPNQNITEAKAHIRQAISKLNKNEKKTQMRKEAAQTEYDKWWGGLSNTAKEAPLANVSAEAYNKTLEQLNMMIEQEKSSLNNLEKKVQTKSQNSGLLND